MRPVPSRPSRRRRTPVSDRTKLPTPRQWERDDPGAATPRCPHCGLRLGIRLAMFTAAGRDVWLCDKCGEIADD
jgi:hypothetical protein